MSQMNLLSVDVSQTPDTQGGSGSLSKKSQTKSSAFSDAMEQHNSSKKTTETDGKDKHDGNLMSKTATEQSPEHNDSNANIIKKLKATKEDDVHTLPVPIEVSDDDAFKEKEKPNDDAHTLPVPLPIQLDDAALKEKLLADDDVHTLPVPLPVAPFSSESSLENKGFQQVEAAHNSDTSVQNSPQNSSSSIKSDSENAKFAENDDAVNLLKMLNGAQKLLTGANAAHENYEQVKSNLTAEQKSLVSSTRAESALLSENNAVLDAKNTTARQNGGDATVVDQKLVDVQKMTKAGATAQESTLTIDSQQMKMAEQNNAELGNIVVDESDELNIATTQKAVPVDTNTDSNNGNKVANNIVSDELDNAQKQDVKQSIIVESQRASEQTQNRTINQSTASVVASNTSIKVDVEQNAIIKEAKESIDKSVSNDVDGEKLAKTESEKPAPLAEKIISSFNQTLDTQVTKPTTSAGELAARQEQSFESSINNLTTNTVQAQKAITTLNTETIAIYRKDFANAVKENVMVMINQKIQQVDIQLDPPEMGNIHVRVNLQNEQAAVQFIVQNQQAKEALEQNMGKLRDMLAENGVDVGDANIEQREAKEQNSSAFGNQAGDGQQGDSADEMLNDNNGSPLNMLKASSTGVDYYA